MTHDKQTRIPGMGRRLAAAASIVALSLGTLALVGCDNDEDLPPMEQSAPMEEPAQDAPMEESAQDDESQGGDAMADPMESQEPMPEEGAMPEEQEPMPEEGAMPEEQEPMPEEGEAPDEEEPGGF